MSNLPRCSCGHSSEEHFYFDRATFKSDDRCEKCECRKFSPSSILQSGNRVADTEEKLREVLRNKYKEFCSFCENHLGLADTSWDETDSSTDCKIICQGCYTILIDISTYRYTNFTFAQFIEALEKFPDRNKIK